jgi:hypothetical protein
MQCLKVLLALHSLERLTTSVVDYNLIRIKIVIMYDTTDDRLIRKEILYR